MEILSPSIAAEVAHYLLEIQAIRLQPEKPFTWASGWKSPIYCDNRLSLQINSNFLLSTCGQNPKVMAWKT